MATFSKLVPFECIHGWIRMNIKNQRLLNHKVGVGSDGKYSFSGFNSPLAYNFMIFYNIN